MNPWRSRPFRAVVFSGLLLGFGVLLGVSVSKSVVPRMDGMTMTGGSAGGMSGMAMPSPGPDAAGGRSAELAVAHADVEAGRFAQAIAVYQRILRDDSHNVEALIHLGVSLAGTGDVQSGLAELDRALAMDPDNLHALWSKAQTLFEIKRDYAASIPVWERVASLVPNSPDGATARAYLARAQEQLRGRPESAPGKRSR